MFKHVMVPLDGSAHAESSLPVAARIARSCGSHLLLMHVAPAPLGPSEASLSPVQHMPTLHEQAMGYLERVRSRRELSGISIETAVYDGVADETIVQVARRRQIDLVVMLSHARKRRGRWLLGSVAKGVVHNAPAPVLLLRQAWQRRPASRWSNVPPHQTFDLLVALDGSPLAEAVLDPAVTLVQALADSKPIRVHLVHVIQVNPLWSSAPSPKTPGARPEEDAVAAAWRYLGGIAERLQAQLRLQHRDQDALQVSWSVPQEAEVAPAIVLMAERGQSLYHPFDLVALSTHGEGGWDRWILGGVTEQVLWGTTLPVLVVRPSTLANPENPEQRAPDSLSLARP